MNEKDVPNLKKTFLSGLHFLIPIFVLIYLISLHEIYSFLFYILCNFIFNISKFNQQNN